MFIWDFNAIFAIVLIVLLGIVFGMKMFYTLSRRLEFKALDQAASFRQCEYCGYVHMDYLNHSLCRCPRCMSYNDGPG